MDEMNGEFAPVSELDSMFENTDTEIVPSDSVQMNCKESNVVLGAEDKVEHLKESTIPSEDENEKQHETGEVSNEENTNAEMKNKEDTKSEAKDEETLEIGSRKKVRKLRKKPKRFKKILSRQKAKGALISMTKLDKDSVIGKVDIEVVPPDVVKMNGKKSTISASMSDINDVTNVVGIEMATADENDTVENFDVRLATSKPEKMNGEESDVVDKDDHLKESIMVSEDEEKKECGVSEASKQESTKEEVKNEEKTINEVKNEGRLEEKIKKKVNRLRKRGKKKTATLMETNEVAAKYTVNPETSKRKSKMTAKGTGMIFMCSSKTKKDCYAYKVLGLPASKRDMVLKVCEGMKLFLFDIDSKLMYGIYKAAGPGGYNIEPKAFKSAFPSQVRFTVQEDCIPLAEKEFKEIIKDNYYSKNKFHCELTSKQVKDLCKLFRVSYQSSESKRLHRSQRAEAPRYVDHESKQLHRSRKAETHTLMDPKPKRLRRSPRAKSRTSLYRDSARHHRWDEERHPAPPRDYLYPEEPVIYRKEVYASPKAYPPPKRPIPLPSAEALPPLLDTYAYRRDQLDTDTYRRDLLDTNIYRSDRLDTYRRDRLDTDIYRRDQQRYHEPQLLDGELRRPQNEFAHRDPYFTSREHSLYRDPLFSSSRPPEYHPRRPSGEYHSSPGLQPEYRPPRSLHRYYS